MVEEGSHEGTQYSVLLWHNSILSSSIMKHWEHVPPAPQHSFYIIFPNAITKLHVKQAYAK